MNARRKARPIKRCTAHTTSGRACRNRPIRGATVCRVHGGSAPQVKAAAKRRRGEEAARAELERLGVPIKSDPLETLLNQVYEASGNVAFLRARVAELHQGLDDPDVETPGLAGPNHLGDGAPHVLVVMYNDERDRLARMAKLCVDAGVAERQVRIAERQGELMARAIRGILDDLRLSAGQQRRVPAVVRRHLVRVSG